MRRLPIERKNGAVEWVEVADGEPAPYPTMNESDEPVDDRLARIYHCDRWATAASRNVDLEAIIVKMAHRVLRAPSHLEAPLQRMRIDRLIEEFGLSARETAVLKEIIHDRRGSNERS